MSKARELASLGNAYSDGALSNRNVLINGSFTVSQRGDYTTAAAYTGGSYYLDRWSMWLGGVTATVQHTTVTVDGVSKRAMKIVATSSGTGYIGARQVIELQNLQVGATYTVSALVRSNNSNVRFRQNALQGQNADGPAFTNDGNWERVSWTFETSGTASNPALGIIAYNNGNVSISTGDYIEFTDVQLEVGDTATPFEHRSYGQELALCQRYCQISLSAGGKGNSSGTQGAWIVPLSPRMRATPSVTLRSLTYHVDEYWTLARSISGVSYLYGYGEAGNGVGIVAAVPCNVFAQLGLEGGAFMFDAEL